MVTISTISPTFTFPQDQKAVDRLWKLLVGFTLLVNPVLSLMVAQEWSRKIL